MAISIDDLLRRAVESRASDLHLKVGNHPYTRVDGILNPLNNALAFSWAPSPRASVLKYMWKPWSRGYASRLAST